jgi:hypothetical protein
MARLNVEVTPGFTQITADHSDIEPVWLTVTTAEGKPATNLGNRLNVVTLDKPPNAVGDLELGWNYAAEQYPGFYRALISPAGNETWKKGFYVIGFVFTEPTLGSLYPPKILASNNGQALLFVHV